LLHQFHTTTNDLQDPQIGLSKYTKLYTLICQFVIETQQNFDEAELEMKGNLPDED
jgi:hypothetical protein